MIRLYFLNNLLEIQGTLIIRLLHRRCDTAPNATSLSPTGLTTAPSADSASSRWGFHSESGAVISFHTEGRSIQGAPSGLIVGLDWLWFGLFHHLPGSAWAAWLMEIDRTGWASGQDGGTARSKSTQPNYMRPPCSWIFSHFLPYT